MQCGTRWALTKTRLDALDSRAAIVIFRMQITLKLNGNLKNYSPGKKEEAQLEIESALPIRALLARLGVPDSSVWMTAVNDQVVDDSTALHEGDLLEVFEPVGGG